MKNAPAGSRRKHTLKDLAERTRTALGKQASSVRRGVAKTRVQLHREARRLDIRGRSKMGKDELRRAIRRRGGKAD